MAQVLEDTETPPFEFVVHPTRATTMDDDEFFDFCQANGELRIERTAEGDISIMAPEGGSSGRGNAKLARILDTWAEQDGTGQVFGSSAGFTLPNKAMRAPDVAWVRNERLKAITDEQWQKFLPLCPDFVLELRSPSDSMRTLRAKMEEYIANGAQLGWLIDPDRRQVHIYRPGHTPEILNDPQQVSGEPVLPGFVLDVPMFWQAMRLPGTK